MRNPIACVIASTSNEVSYEETTNSEMRLLGRQNVTELFHALLVSYFLINDRYP